MKTEPNNSIRQTPSVLRRFARSPMNSLQKLQAWYLSACNGDWEHSSGVTIGTLDNPGWSFTVDLMGTSLEGKQFTTRRHGVGEGASPEGIDWIYCEVENNQFCGHGGPEKLEELIQIFLAWAQE